MAKKFSIKKFAAGVLALLMVVTALPVSGIASTTAKAADDTVNVYRSYNPNSGEHLLTINKDEHDFIVKEGRTDEGIRWVAPVTSQTPVYRSYNPNTGEHLLVPKDEAEWLETQGWDNEGIKMYSDDNKGVPVYRVYNPNATDAGTHLYTSDKEESDWLVAQGWKYDNDGDPVLYAVDAEIVDELSLESVEAGVAPSSGKYNVVIAYFNTPVGDLTATDVQIRQVSNDQLYSVEKVVMSSDKKTATLTLTNTSAAGANVEGLSANVDYELIVTSEVGKASKVFSIPAVADGVTVYDRDLSKNTVTTGTWSSAAPTTTSKYTIPEDLDVDLNFALGRTVTIKYDKNSEALSFSYSNNEKVILSAFKEVVPTSGAKYLLDLATEEKYYVQEAGTAALPASVEDAIDSWKGTPTAYGTDGTAAAATGWTSGDTFKYGKLVLNANGTIKDFIHLTSWSGQMIVSKTNGDYIVGMNGQEQTLKDYTILNDGWTIEVSDIEEGDVVFFNSTYKFAEVYDNVVTAPIDAVYDDAGFKFDGKDRDGSSAYYYDGASLSSVTTDYLKSLKSSGEDVTVYYDRSLTPVFVIGTQGEASTSSYTMVLTAEGDGYTDKTSSMIRLKGFNGISNVTEDIDVSTIKEIDFATTSAAIVAGGNAWKTTLGTIAPGTTFSTATTGETLGYTGTASESSIKINSTTAGTGDALFKVGRIVQITKNDKGVVTKIAVGAPVIKMSATKDTFDSITAAKNPDFKAGYSTITTNENSGNSYAGAALPISGAELSASTPIFILSKEGGAIKASATVYGAFTDSVSNAEFEHITLYPNSAMTAIDAIVIDNTDGTALGDVADGSTAQEVVISDIKYLNGEVSGLSVISQGTETTYEKFGSGTGISTNTWAKGNIVKITVLKDEKTVSNIESPDGSETTSAQFYGVTTTTPGGAYIVTGTDLVPYSFESDATITLYENNTISTISLSDLKAYALKMDVSYSLKAAGGKSIDTIVVSGARTKTVKDALKSYFGTSMDSATAAYGGTTNVYDAEKTITSAASAEVNTINSVAKYKGAVALKGYLDILISDYNAISTSSTDKFDAHNDDAGLATTAGATYTAATTGAIDVALYNALVTEISRAGNYMIVGAAAVPKTTAAGATLADSAEKIPTTLHVVLASGTEKDIEVTVATPGDNTATTTSDFKTTDTFAAGQDNTFRLSNQTDGLLLDDTYYVGDGVQVDIVVTAPSA